MERWLNLTHLIAVIIGIVSGAVGAWLGSRVRLDAICGRLDKLEAVVKKLPEEFVELGECRTCKQLSKIQSDRIENHIDSNEQHVKDSLASVIKKQDEMSRKLDLLGDRMIRVLAQLFPKYVPGDGDK